jgi:DnaK suppressor protein
LPVGSEGVYLEGRMAGVLSDEIDVLAKARRAMPGDYVPSDDEPYMGEAQLDISAAFCSNGRNRSCPRRLARFPRCRTDRCANPISTIAHRVTDWGIELRTRDRQRKLIAKIDSAMRRIDEGEYGFCEVTGEPIGLGRLIARPIATMTVEAQEAHERREKISRDM